ncbi:amino acid adenylation domain-containing protein [Catenuloplanes nepalensis]|uniref:Amino acid adenylation domain-containing protein n=1 Tax=Catenuloplanes nepalensis TaxID=587533 RepID=A0ABT9MS12_9ACTN|nr:non-ribosomal peptide synthetase [Catenuloplanes nepalensis]MDP9794188.1 amino acid adenylation domain-containing protein [Catenuloplanes nepalensis]
MSDLTTTIPVLPDDGEPVMSYAQERLWFMDAYAPGSTAYTIPEVWRLHGAVDPEALRAALDRVAARHEPLRTRFPATVDGRPVVHIDADGTIPLDVVDGGDVPTLLDDFLAVPFDLATGPVARALLISVSPAEHVFALAIHHIAADGWATELLLGEVLADLAGEPLPELPVRYRDFAAWQRALPGAEEDVAYWREQLAGVAPLELPTDRPRPPVPSHAGAAHDFSVPPEVMDALFRIGRKQRATPYMVLLAAWAVLLGRRARQDDVTIGSPTAGRPLPELDDLVGCFINMVPMRVDASGDPTFAELLQRVRVTAGNAFAHQELPFERLVTELNVPREVSRSPLFQVVFAMQSYEAAEHDRPGLTVTTDVDISYRVTRFDLELHTAGDGDFLMVYNTALFTADSIARLAAHFRMLLAGIAAGPHAPISRYELLTDPERAERVRWNDTGADLGPDECLHAPVAARAAATPGRPAVMHPGGTLSHAEVDRRADHLAARLAGAGVCRGDLVAVVMARGWEQVVAVLAINKAGGAYLPVDADLPDRRRHELIARGGCTVAVTQPARHARLTWPDGLTVLDVTDSPGDPATAGTDSSGDPASAPSADPGDLAYVIFTSGSTGTPKGVMITHRAALNTVRDITARFRVGPDDRVFALSALSFDLSVYDVYGTLAAGATLVMGRPEEDKDPAAWARIVTGRRITVWNSVPALMELLVEHAEREGTDLTSLRLVMMSGDWIPPSLPGRIRALAPDAEIISLGGATEGSIWSIFHPIGEVDPAWPSIPYGRPLANQQFHILDRGMCDVPVGVPGDLYIGGDGVAAGYWRDPERTAAAFVTHPRTGTALYRTGDLGRYHSDGVIEFLGRADAQVKIRGYRIELGEIEAHLIRHPGVDECVVTTHGTGTAAQLVAYVAGAAAGAALRSHLTAALPAYMVPTVFVPLDRLPLTANGKVDRGRLPAPSAPAAGADRAAPETDSERLIHAVWAGALDRDDIGIDDDFFSAGGHSLMAIKVVERMRRAAGDDSAFAVMDLFTHPTIRRLAARLDSATTAPDGLLHRLTTERSTTLSYIAVPFGGGTAMAYKPLADALPDTHALWSVALPRTGEPLEEIAARCVREIQDRVTGPIALYGHCGVGSALIVEIARLLEAAGRIPEAVYLGAIFPFARPGGALDRFVNPDTARSDRSYADGLTGIGLETSDLDPEQARRIVHDTRRDTEAAEDYYTRLFAGPAGRLRAPVISVAGELDSASDFHGERFREWHHLADTTAVVLLDEAGHYFQKHRAAELAEIVTTVHPAVAAGTPAGGDAWRLRDVSHGDAPDGPSWRGFLAVTAAQLVSLGGTATAMVALSIWVLLAGGSPVEFALSAVAGVIPGLLVAPWAGRMIDGADRRAVLLAAGAGAGGTALLLALTENPQTWHAYPALALLSVALTFQRLAHDSAVPQLVPKRYLGHATGTVRLAMTTGRLIVPVAAVALLALAGLPAVLAVAVLGSAVAVVVTLLTRFPKTMPGSTTITIGLGYVWGDARLRRMLIFLVALHLLLSPLFLLIPPLVVATGGLTGAAWVLLGAAAGGVLGGLVIRFWGGPARHRMRALVLCTLPPAAFALLIGLHPSLATIGLGAFGTVLALTVLDGIRAAVVEVKVPEHVHGPVSALHAIITWPAYPLVFGLLAAAALPLLGPGREIGTPYLLLGPAIALLAAVALAVRLPGLVDDSPDATPADLVGLRALGRTSPHTGTADHG